MGLLWCGPSADLALLDLLDLKVELEVELVEFEIELGRVRSS